MIKETGIDVPECALEPQKVSIVQHNIDHEEFCILMCEEMGKRYNKPGAVFKYTPQGDKMHNNRSHCCDECRKVITDRLKKLMSEADPDIQVKDHVINNPKKEQKELNQCTDEERKWN